MSFTKTTCKQSKNRGVIKLAPINITNQKQNKMKTLQQKTESNYTAKKYDLLVADKRLTEIQHKLLNSAALNFETAFCECKKEEDQKGHKLTIFDESVKRFEKAEESLSAIIGAISKNLQNKAEPC